MSTTDLIALIASAAALLTAVGGLWYQRHSMEMDRKKFFKNYPEERFNNWLGSLTGPAKRSSAGNLTDAKMPYQAGAPIRHMELYFGCQNQLEIALNSVLGKQMASTWVLGARQSGKTSFFLHLRSLLNSDDYPQIVPVYIDAQSAISSEKNFFACMLREASAELTARNKANSRPPEIPNEVEFEKLTTFLEQTSKKQWRFVFLVDEFERLLMVFDEDLFASLRSLILKANISWIIASVRAVDMAGTKTSPFTNIIQETIMLGSLSREDARLLVADPAAKAGNPFETEDIDLILNLAGRLPFPLQKASLLLYKLHLAGITGQSGRQRLMEIFKMEMQSDFESQLTILSPVEKEALFKLALHKNVDKVEIFHLLERYGFVEKSPAGYQILGQTFTDFLYQKAKEAGLTTR
jgi:hypothetical protein